MTREEIEDSKAYQVSKAALEYYNEHHQDNDIDLTDAFEAGAKWADENSNSNGEELLYVAQKTAERVKKEVINKACEWLKENIDLYSYNAFSSKSGYTEITLTDVFETAFKQAMEE